MRINHSSILGTLITLTTSACMGGTGSLLTGVSGNGSAFTGTITVSLASNSTGATLSGTTAVGARDGIATFSNLAVDKAGTYRLQASAAGAAAVTSSSFTITSPVTP